MKNKTIINQIIKYLTSEFGEFKVDVDDPDEDYYYNIKRLSGISFEDINLTNRKDGNIIFSYRFYYTKHYDLSIDEFKKIENIDDIKEVVEDIKKRKEDLSNRYKRDEINRI
jgi:hypothetical protein